MSRSLESVDAAQSSVTIFSTSALAASAWRDDKYEREYKAGSPFTWQKHQSSSSKCRRSFVVGHSSSVAGIDWFAIGQGVCSDLSSLFFALVELFLELRRPLVRRVLSVRFSCTLRSRLKAAAKGRNLLRRALAKVAAPSSRRPQDRANITTSPIRLPTLHCSPGASCGASGLPAQSRCSRFLAVARRQRSSWVAHKA